MNVVHVSRSDTKGGAAIAAFRICSAQQNFPSLHSKLLVQTKSIDNEIVLPTKLNTAHKILTKVRCLVDELLIRLLTKTNKGRFSFPYFGENIANLKQIKNSDIINFHWINGGFLSLNSIKKIAYLNKPVVWTLHDMWAFTGGCHYAAECTKFISECADCPSLLFHSSKDLANKIFLKKQNVFKNLNLTIVTCSNWLAKESEKSFLLNRNKIVVIPNPINSDLYKPLNKKICKQKFNIPQYKKVILTGAANLKDKRKGFNYLIKAINILINKNMSLKNDLVLVVFGQIDKQVIDCISIETIQLGRLNNELDIIDAYNVADVFVLPSLQDNLPNTIMESLSCGVPVVAFNVGGIPDMIDDRQNGILAKVESVAELANGIEQLLTDEELHKKFSIAAREKVIKNFDQKIVAEKYLALYNSVKI